MDFFGPGEIIKLNTLSLKTLFGETRLTNRVIKWRQTDVRFKDVISVKVPYFECKPHMIDSPRMWQTHQVCDRLTTYVTVLLTTYVTVLLTTYVTDSPRMWPFYSPRMWQTHHVCDRLTTYVTVLLTTYVTDSPRMWQTHPVCDSFTHHVCDSTTHHVCDRITHHVCDRITHPSPRFLLLLLYLSNRAHFTLQ